LPPAPPGKGGQSGKYGGQSRPGLRVVYYEKPVVYYEKPVVYYRIAVDLYRIAVALYRLSVDLYRVTACRIL